MAELAAMVDDWRIDAACREVDPELFFPPAGPIGLASAAAARRVCAGCPVRRDCLEAALRVEDGRYGRYGMWGGMTPKERYQLSRCRAGTCRHTNGCPEVTP